MKFNEYKCLESLLNIGEEIITNESYIVNNKSLFDIIKFNRYLNKFKYGISIDGEEVGSRNTTAEDWDKYYKPVTPSQFLKQHGGTCFDYTAYEAQYFKNTFKNISFDTYFCYFDLKDRPSHSFLIFKMNNEYYHFESSFKKIVGIWKSQSINDLISNVLLMMNKYRDKHCKDELFKFPYYIYKFNALNPSLFNISCDEYYDTIINNIGKQINFKLNKFPSVENINEK